MKAIFDIVKFETCDVITASTTTPGGNQGGAGDVVYE